MGINALFLFFYQGNFFLLIFFFKTFYELSLFSKSMSLNLIKSLFSHYILNNLTLENINPFASFFGFIDIVHITNLSAFLMDYFFDPDGFNQYSFSYLFLKKKTI